MSAPRIPPPPPTSDIPPPPAPLTSNNKYIVSSSHSPDRHNNKHHDISSHSVTITDHSPEPSPTPPPRISYSPSPSPNSIPPPPSNPPPSNPQPRTKPKKKHSIKRRKKHPPNTNPYNKTKPKHNNPSSNTFNNGKQNNAKHTNPSKPMIKQKMNHQHQHQPPPVPHGLYDTLKRNSEKNLDKKKERDFSKKPQFFQKNAKSPSISPSPKHKHKRTNSEQVISRNDIKMPVITHNTKLPSNDKKNVKKPMVDSPRPKLNNSTSAKIYTLRTDTDRHHHHKLNKGRQGITIIPQDKQIEIKKSTHFPLKQSASSPTRINTIDEDDDDHHHHHAEPLSFGGNINVAQSTKSTHSTHTQSTHSSPSSEENINPFLLMQNIETYKVIFKTRVCGIELVPFDEAGNIGAVVIKCHTQYSKEKVILKSLLIGIDGQCVIDRDYDEILGLISSSGRPIKLTFHPPNVNKNGMNHHKEKEKEEMMMHHNDNNHDNHHHNGHHHHHDNHMNGHHQYRPSLLMKWNDEFMIDAEYDQFQNNLKYMHPNTLFNDDRNDRNDIQKFYKLLYDKFCELSQFQELTKNTIHTKIDEIKRLSQENMHLKGILNERESELQQIQNSQSTEKQKGREILDKYKKLNDKNIQIEKKNIEQQQQIESLKYQLQQSQMKVRELKRIQNEYHQRYTQSQPMPQTHHKHHHHHQHKKRHNKHQHKPINISSFTKHQQHNNNHSKKSKKGKHTKRNTLDDQLQHELRKKLSVHRDKTAPPPLKKSMYNTLNTPLRDKGHQHRPRTTNDINDRLKTNDSSKISKQKRPSAIGMFFKNFSRRKESDLIDTNNKNAGYHPSLTEIVKQRRKITGKATKTVPLSDNAKRARSNSLETDPNKRQRKETIV